MTTADLRNEERHAVTGGFTDLGFVATNSKSVPNELRKLIGGRIRDTVICATGPTSCSARPQRAAERSLAQRHSVEFCALSKSIRTASTRIEATLAGRGANPRKCHPTILSNSEKSPIRCFTRRAKGLTSSLPWRLAVIRNREIGTRLTVEFRALSVGSSFTTDSEFWRGQKVRIGGQVLSILKADNIYYVKKSISGKLKNSV